MSADQNPENKNNKGPVIAVVAVVVALVAGGAFFATSSRVPLESTADTAAVEETATEAVGTGTTDVQEDAAAVAAEAPAADATTAATATPEQAAPAPAQLDIVEGDPVVAKVNNTEIKRSEVLNFITTLPEQVRQMPVQNLFPLAVDQVVNNRIIGDKASTANLANDPDVTKMLDEAKEQIIRNVYVERELAKSVSEAELRSAYDKMVAGLGKVEEVRARHILVADEAKAKDIIAKLKAGTSFEDLSKESTDTASAANGGDLGYFAKTDMVPEFAEAAFSQSPGSVSEIPVKTQFGWHVIKVEDKRTRPAPAYDAVKPQIEAQLRREKLGGLLESWQSEAKAEKFDINGQPLNPATPQ